MKSRLVLDQFANMRRLPEGYAEKVKFQTGKDGRAVAYFPVGTEFDGAHALVLCRTGQAEPADDECAAALGMTDAQRQQLQLDYKMNTLGINSKEDRELYRAGVIDGYNADGSYKLGKNWAAYQAARADNAEGDDI